MTPDIEDIYTTGKVHRYHANPHLNVVGQTDADHTWGVVMLLYLLHGDPSPNLVRHAIFHDSGERRAGDLPHPVKVANPKLASEHKILEEQMLRDMGIELPELTEEEHHWLKLCDRLESQLLAKLYHPDSFRLWNASGLTADIIDLAHALGVSAQITKILQPKEYSAHDW